MQYNHTIKTETIIENTIIDCNEGFTSIEIFYQDSYGAALPVIINSKLKLQAGQWFRMMNRPYVKINSNIRLQIQTKGTVIVVIKHFYVEQ